MQLRIKIIVISLITFLTLSFFVSTVRAQYFYPTKEILGLNVHWVLGGSGDLDKLYERRLRESKTVWVREHLYTEVFYGDNPGWADRYEEKFKKYKQMGIKVVVMLAYGRDHGDFTTPSAVEWKGHVDYMARRFGKYIDVWEIWNEPDSPDYLEPNNVTAYLPILEIAHERISKLDPSAKILAGALASPNSAFADELYQKTNKFDALSFHLYYCGYRRDDGNYDRLVNDLQSFKSVIDKHEGARPWITEMGCSTGEHGISESFQTQYLDEATRVIIGQDFVDKIFLYNVRNYDFRGVYEDNFGLLTKAMSPRNSWNWYRRVPIGPYNQERVSSAEIKSKALKLRRILERYFGEYIPLHADHWPKYVEGYVYGGYSIKSLVQAIRYGGPTMHQEIPYYLWKERQEYKNYINEDWTGGLIVYAYGKPRTSAIIEGEKAVELKNYLNQNYQDQDLRIDGSNWINVVKAYVYGGYPKEIVAKMYICGGAVHPQIDYNSWKDRSEHKSCFD